MKQETLPYTSLHSDNTRNGNVSNNPLYRGNYTHQQPNHSLQDHHPNHHLHEKRALPHPGESQRHSRLYQRDTGSSRPPVSRYKLRQQQSTTTSSSIRGRGLPSSSSLPQQPQAPGPVRWLPRPFSPHLNADISVTGSEISGEEEEELNDMSRDMREHASSAHLTRASSVHSVPAYVSEDVPRRTMLRHANASQQEISSMRRYSLPEDVYHMHLQQYQHQGYYPAHHQYQHYPTTQSHHHHHGLSPHHLQQLNPAPHYHCSCQCPAPYPSTVLRPAQSVSYLPNGGAMTASSEHWMSDNAGGGKTPPLTLAPIMDTMPLTMTDTSDSSTSQGKRGVCASWYNGLFITLWVIIAIIVIGMIVGVILWATL